MIYGCGSQWFARYSSTLGDRIKVFEHLGGQDYCLRWRPTYHQMLLDTKNKSEEYVWFMGKIATIWDILKGTSCLRGEGPPYVVMIYLPSDATWHKNLCGLGVGISMVFEIVGHFLYQGDRTSPYCHDLYTIRCSLTQKTRICMV
jgi:hypothetical protein